MKVVDVGCGCARSGSVTLLLKHQHRPKRAKSRYISGVTNHILNSLPFDHQRWRGEVCVCTNQDFSLSLKPSHAPRVTLHYVWHDNVVHSVLLAALLPLGMASFV